MDKDWTFDWKLLDDKNNGDHVEKLKALCTECGIAQLKIDEQFANFIFAQKLATRLQEQIKCMCRLFVIEGYNFA